MFGKTNKTIKTTKTSTGVSKPIFEKLEDRRLQSTTPAPLNYDGQYVNYTNNTRFEVDFKHSTAATKYTGDVKTGKLDYKLTATETSNKLTGNIVINGKNNAFTAVLSGRTLTLTMGKNKVVYTKRIQVMAPHTAGIFEYDAPTGFTAKANAGGMLIKSADGTQQVAVVTGVQYGWVAPQTLVNNAISHGTKVMKNMNSQLFNLGGGIYMAYEVSEITYNVGKTNFTSDVVIASLYTGTYNVTKVGMASVTAPTSVFAQKGGVLVDVLTSIHQLSAGVASPAASIASPAAQIALSAASNATTSTASALTNSNAVASPAAAPAVIWTDFDFGYTFTNGFYDPGVAGNWAEGYTTGWVSPFVAAEQVYIAQSSSAFDLQVAQWHAQFNAD